MKNRSGFFEITAAVWIIAFGLAGNVSGQTAKFTKPYKYTASNDDSRNSAKAKAMEEAQAALLQEIGVLVEARQKMTTSVSGNNKQEDFVEELKTYTIGKVQTVIIAGTEKFTENEKGDMIYSATFSMVVDTADLYKYLDNIVKQKEQARLADIQKQQKIEILRKEVLELKKQFDAAKLKEAEISQPLNFAKNKLGELKTQKDIAEQDYRTSVNASNATTQAGIAKTQNASHYLSETQNRYNAQEAEYKKLESLLISAQNDVNKAQNNLYDAEVLLAKETGTAVPEKSKQTQATAGSNTVLTVQANTQTRTEPAIQGTVVPGNTLTEKLAWLKRSADSHNTYILEVNADENIAPHTFYYEGAINITIVLRGVGANRTIRLKQNATMFTVKQNVIFVLDNNITLQGHSQNTGSMVKVSGGTVRMNDGSNISGNNGGGVLMEGNDATLFEMIGGTISGNTAYNGGGVCVSSGTFEMNGGTISGNTAKNEGGGVYSLRKFTMYNGTISGNEANSGGGVMAGGRAYGTFDMRGGTIKSNTAREYGGGVYLEFHTGFTKTGGTITGYNSDPNGGNKVVDGSGTISRRGHAVYAVYPNKRKETTAGPKVNLSYNSTNWDE